MEEHIDYMRLFDACNTENWNEESFQKKITILKNTLEFVWQRGYDKGREAGNASLETLFDSEFSHLRKLEEIKTEFHRGVCDGTLQLFWSKKPDIEKIQVKDLDGNFVKITSYAIHEDSVVFTVLSGGHGWDLNEIGWYGEPSDIKF